MFSRKGSSDNILRIANLENIKINTIGKLFINGGDENCTKGTKGTHNRSSAIGESLPLKGNNSSHSNTITHVATFYGVFLN